MKDEKLLDALSCPKAKWGIINDDAFYFLCPKHKKLAALPDDSYKIGNGKRTFGYHTDKCDKCKYREQLEDVQGILEKKVEI